MPVVCRRPAVACRRCPTGAVASAPGTRHRTAGSRYRVRPGDTVFDLAAAHGTSMAALVAANRLPAPAG